MFSESVIIAIVAVSSPIIVGVVKELFSARKVNAQARMQGYIADSQTTEKQNEFLHVQLQEFRAYHETQMDAWRTRYDALRDKYDLERDKVIRLETRHELRASMRKPSVKSLPPHMEGEIDFIKEFHADLDAVVFADENGRIIDMSPRAKLMFGYMEPGASIIGKPLTVLMPERFHADHQSGLGRLMAGHQSNVLGRLTEVDCIKSSGEEFKAELTVQQFRVHGVRYFAGVFREAEGH